MEPQLFSCGLIVSLTASEGYSSMLQWSRNFSVADCCKSVAMWLRPIFASMEPQLFSCGLCITIDSDSIIQCCFNGAATFQLRIEVENGVIQLGDTGFNGAATFQLRIAASIASMTFVASASMEPQLFSCGLAN